MIDPRSVVHLHDEQGMSFGEIAKAIDAPRSSVTSAYYRHKKSPQPDDKPQTRVHRSETTNELTVGIASADIHTLDQLLSYCEVDLDEWTVQRHIVNKWPVGRKNTIKDLTWEDGIVTGHVRDYGDIMQEGLIQVKAWLVRKNPVALRPCIVPVTIDAPSAWAQVKERPAASGRSLVGSDLHVGFRRRVGKTLDPIHDRAAIATFVELAAAVKPDRVDILGDLLDLPDWTDKFLRTPDMQQLTQPALIELAFWLSKLRSVLPGVPITIYEGNHGLRLRNAIAKSLPAAFDLRSVDRLDLPVMSLRNLLGLDKLGIGWIGDYPNNESYLGTVRLEHGDITRQNPGDTAKAIVQNADESSVCGHVHRLEKVYRTMYTSGRVSGFISATTSGCLCRLEPGIVPGHTKRQNWQHGAVVIDYDKGASLEDIHLVHIKEGIALWSRFSVHGEIPVKELRDKYPGWGF